MDNREEPSISSPRRGLSIIPRCLGAAIALGGLLTATHASAEVKVALGKVRGPGWSRVRAAIQVALTAQEEIKMVRTSPAARIGGRIEESRSTLVANLEVRDAKGEVRGRARFRGRDPKRLAANIKVELWSSLGPALLSLGEARASGSEAAAASPLGVAAPAPRAPERSPRAVGSQVERPSAVAVSRGVERAADASVASSPPPVSQDGPGEMAREAFRFAFGMGLFFREFSWADNICAESSCVGGVPGLSSYSLGSAPAFRASAEWFPGAHFSAGPAGWVGVELEAELPFAVESARQGVVFPTAASAWRAGLLGRLPFERLEATARFGYAERRFAIEQSDDGTTVPNLPEVRYQSLEARLGLSVRVVEALEVFAQGGWGFMLDSGEIGRSNWFPRSSSHLASAGVGANVHLFRGVGLFARFDWQGAFFDLQPEPGDPFVAGGASDQYLLGSAGVRYVAPGI